MKLPRALVSVLTACIALAGCAEPIATNAAPVLADPPCVRCPEWFAAPGSVELGSMCLESSRLAADVLECADNLGDCAGVMHDEAPNPECSAALADSCAAVVDFCAGDVPAG